MSSEKDLVSKKAKFTLQRTSSRGKSRALISPYWRQETPQRSSSRSKLVGPRKISKIDKGNNKSKTSNETTKKAKKPIMERPSPPHNTNQYLMYANNNCEEMPSLYMGHDRFKFDFEHHAMAGSMMDLMMNKLAEPNQKMTTEGEEQGEKTDGVVVDSGEGLLGVNGSCIESVNNSVNNGLATDLCNNIADRDHNKVHNDPYSHYLREAETGEDLQSVVRQLVNILGKKDQQINLIKLKGQLENVEKR